MANLILIGTRVVPFLLQAAQPNPGAMTAEQLKQQIALEAVRHSNPESILALLVPFAGIAMVLVIVWLKMRQRQAQVQTRAEFHKQLLDKFGSGREFAEFLESKGSQRFLEELWSQSPESKERPRMTPGLRNGILLAMLGLALSGLSWMWKELLIPGVILLALGVGYLISSAISYRPSKKWSQTKESGPGNAPAP